MLDTITNFRGDLMNTPQFSKSANFRYCTICTLQYPSSNFRAKRVRVSGEALLVIVFYTHSKVDKEEKWQTRSANNTQTTRKQHANNTQTTRKQHANKHANNTQNNVKQHANNTQTTRKQHANTQTTRKQHAKQRANNTQTTMHFMQFSRIVECSCCVRKGMGR
jgi:hypothetical protein